MEITVLDADGLPPKTYISVRVGETRRQAPYQRNEVFSFPKLAGPSFAIDVFEKLGTSQVSLLGIGEVGTLHVDPCIQLTNGSTKVNLKVDLTDPTERFKKPQKVSRQHAALKAKSYLDDHHVPAVLQDMVQQLLAQRPDDPWAFVEDFIRDHRRKSTQRLDSSRFVPSASLHQEEPPPPPPSYSPRGPGSHAATEVTLCPLENGNLETVEEGGTVGSAEGSAPQNVLPKQERGRTSGESDFPGFPTDVCPDVMPDLSAHFSVMAEVLKHDPRMYERLRSRRTPAGSSFARIIKPGIDNKGHPMIRTTGLVACDCHCYETFRELFDKVLALQEVPAPWKNGSCISVAPLDPKHVTSVQVHLRRNVAAFRFPSACSLEERREVERLLVAGLLEHGGTYFPLRGSQSFDTRLGGMNEQDERELDEKKVLFEEPDSSVMVSSGLGRHWPDARGVFTNQSLWACINEEDHIKLSCAELTSDLQAVYAHLVSTEELLVESLARSGHTFARGHQGILTTCPTNVGTGLRVGVTVRLPSTGRAPSFRAHCTALQLQVRCIDVDVYELTNCERYGSAVEQMNCVIFGCRELVDVETRAQVKHIPVPLADVPDLEEVCGKSWTSECPEEVPDLSQHFSLLAHVLKMDPAVYRKLRNARTSTGVSLAQLIKPGMENRGHPLIKTIGVVPGDEESFVVFQELFDRVIALRHGFTEDVQHRTDLDPSKLDLAPMDPDGVHVLSVQLRASRNVKGFRLPTTCSLDERRDIERLVVQALWQTVDGDYFPLAASESYPKRTDPEEETRLRDAGHLLQEPDSAYLLSSGLGRDWPDARGVFASGTLDVAVHVNEYDHVMMCVKSSVGSFSGIFARLSRLHEELNMALAHQGHGFMHHERLGFLTASLSNLGSGLTASATVRLPMVSQRPDFKETCRTLQLLARRDGTSGDWEMSNLARLGWSEVDLVNSLTVGCKRLVAMEQAMLRGDKVPRPGLDTPLPGFPLDTCPLMPDLSAHASLLARVLRENPAIYTSLRDSRTASGVTFAQTVKPCVDVRVGKSIGVFVGDAESYDTFAAALVPAIEAFHGTARVSHPDGETMLVCHPLQRAVSVKVSLARNLRHLRFPPACDHDERCEVKRVLGRALGELGGDLHGRYHPLGGSCTRRPSVPNEPLRRKHRNLFEEPQDLTALAAGIGRDWPVARGIFANDTGSFAALINGEDHLSLVAAQDGGDLAGSLELLLAAERSVRLALKHQGFRFAKCSRLGYLTASPERLGTGLKASLVLSLANSARRFDLAEHCASFGLDLVQSLPGGLVEVQRRAGLADSGPVFVNSFMEAADKLASGERE